jgi:hypothetical protein
MAIERRTILKAATASAACALVPWLPGAAAAARRLYVSARADRAGGFYFAGVDAAGKRIFDVPLPGRGHGAAVHPRLPLAVAFARRPGRFALAVDWRRGRVTANFQAPDGRHFYGHGVFSADGRLLYACENDYEKRRGVVGIYETTRGFARLGELPTHGIGPHDLRLLADGNTLAVANGGIATHPDLPRLKLNIPTMAPSLALIDRRDGRLIAKQALAHDFHQASIRHLDATRDGRIAVAMQYEGPRGDLVPLLAVSERGGPLKAFDKPAGAIRALRQYCGSVAFDEPGAVIATSSPRGGVLEFWQAERGRHLFTAKIADGCGVAPAGGPGRFLASSGRGGLFHIDVKARRVARLAAGPGAGVAWDNHLIPGT